MNRDYLLQNHFNRSFYTIRLYESRQYKCFVIKIGKLYQLYYINDDPENVILLDQFTIPEDMAPNEFYRGIAERQIHLVTCTLIDEAFYILSPVMKWVDVDVEELFKEEGLKNMFRELSMEYAGLRTRAIPVSLKKDSKETDSEEYSNPLELDSVEKDSERTKVLSESTFVPSFAKIH